MNAPGWPARSAVILLNLGTPLAPTARAVSRFLAEFLSDRRVVELPRLLWQPILRGIVIPLRAKRVAHAYASIWREDSPLRAISAEQQRKLQQSLRETLGDEAPWVRVAMSYQGPGLAQEIDLCRAAGIDHIVLLPLYPQYSATTTAVAYDQLGRYLARRRDLPHLSVIRDYHDCPAYIDALAASVREHWQQQGARGHLLMSFHGIPVRNVELGDPYAAQCRRTAALLAARLELEEGAWSLAFQSRFGKAKWLEPYTDLTLQALARSGTGAVDVICPAFSSDCLETLEEIAIANRELFLSSGGSRYATIGCLNARDDHIAMMCSLVLAAPVLRTGVDAAP